MNTLLDLSALDLHQHTLTAAQAEKSATLHLLECLHAVETRRVFAERGYSSLFDYVHRGLGYSESHASERVRAMRLTFQIPEIKTQLAQGALTLTSVARIASHAKREQLTSAAITALAQTAAHQSVREVDRLLVSQSTHTQPVERVRAVSPKLTELKLQVSAEFMALLSEAQELEPNPGATLTQVLETALFTHLAQKRKLRAKTDSTFPIPEKTSPLLSTAVGAHAPRSRHVPRATQRALWHHSKGQCQFTDPATQTRCTSRRALQIEHVRSFAKGGTLARENLRHYCPAHNRLTAIQEFGATKARRIDKPRSSQ